MPDIKTRVLVADNYASIRRMLSHALPDDVQGLRPLLWRDPVWTVYALYTMTSRRRMQHFVKATKERRAFARSILGHA
jgi:hypothetical protein